ncbi:aminotransferase class V-fold PLP-dependent enzyme [Micromonospora sp. CPCC 206060]|uniref:aminotransferase class V-fold PLP-dependent enzyme n=1 Tax=Micromonospora sp. CPCC 206060 TaxID=3122406 RepID=UPI002FEF009E
MAQHATGGDPTTGPGPADTDPAPLTDPAAWRRVRQLFPLDTGGVYLNTAAVGSVPTEVLDLLGAADREYARNPRDPYADTAVVAARTTLAASYGCAPDEIAITQSATDATTRILHGLDLAPGDEILTTSHECFTVRSPLALLAQRRGVVLRRLDPPVGPAQRAEQIVEMFAAAITDRTRVIQWPAVSLTIGTTFPTRELAELAQRHGLVSVVDGAQVPGQFVLDLHATGVDFLSASGGKYQCGPLGSGFLYARNRVLPEHNPAPLPAFWPVVSLTYPVDGTLPPRSTSREAGYDLGALLQQTDSADLSRAAALAAAAQLFDRLGRARVQQYVLGLGEHLKQRVIEHWGPDRLLSPYDDRRLHSSIVAFQPFTDPADLSEFARFMEFETRMQREHGIAVQCVGFAPKEQPPSFAIRLSPHLYNSREEIDHAVEAMRKVTEGLAR